MTKLAPENEQLWHRRAYNHLDMACSPKGAIGTKLQGHLDEGTVVEEDVSEEGRTRGGAGLMHVSAAVGGQRT